MLTSLITLTVVYGVLAVVEVGLITRFVRRGITTGDGTPTPTGTPDGPDRADEPEDDVLSVRLLSPATQTRSPDMDLQTLWFAAVAVLWTGFLLLEGFDFGVAALLPVLGRRPADRHLMLRSIGPLWDGNEVWLITAAGAVFAAFPGWYATWLPALYLPFVIVLLGLIVRAVAFEWRHSSHDPRWDATWTHVITGGSLVAALGVGAALGATTLGLPIDGDGNRVGGSFAGVGWPAVLGAVAGRRRSPSSTGHCSWR